MKAWSKSFTNHVDPRMLDEGWERVQARRSRPRVARWMLVGPAIAMLMVLVFLLRARDGAMAIAGGGELPSEWITSVRPEVVALDDGSRMELEVRSRLRTRKSNARSVDLALESGRVTFDVNPRGMRAWRIDAGAAVIRVLGTRFTVRRDGDVVDVDVERGKVAVDSAAGTQVLVAGESVHLGGAVAAPASAVTPAPIRGSPTGVQPLGRVSPSDSAPAPTAAVASTPAAKTVPTAPAHAAHSEARDAMADADAARRAGKPREAATILAGIVEQHDARAPLAAFTLGKVQAEDLGNDADAATSFERAIALGLPGGLEEEAHARAVESWSRAGRRDAAARAAARYEAKFPNGRHQERVRGWLRD